MLQPFNYNYLQNEEFLFSKQVTDESGVHLESSFSSESYIGTINENSDNTLKPSISILILDDEYLIRNTLKRHLLRINRELKLPRKFIIFEAENCFQALSIIYKKFEKKFYFNIVITDEYMPYMKGSTMIKLLKHLSNEDNFYKLILVSYTSFDTFEKKKFILDHGADFIINKPVTYDEFKQLIVSLVNKINNKDIL